MPGHRNSTRTQGYRPVAAVVYIAVSLLTKPTDPSVMKNWHRRVAGGAAEEEQVPVLTH